MEYAEIVRSPKEENPEQSKCSGSVETYDIKLAWFLYVDLSKFYLFLNEGL